MTGSTLDAKRRRRCWWWHTLRVLAVVMLALGVCSFLWSIVDLDFLSVITGAAFFLFWIWIFKGCSRRLERDRPRVL